MATAERIREAVLTAVEAGIKANPTDIGFRAHIFVARLAALLDPQGEPELVGALDRLRRPDTDQPPPKRTH